MGFFKTIGGLVRDVAVPFGLSFLGPAGPLLAATYSGINTGIKTGSPLAGLGAAGLSFGLSSATRGITDKIASKTLDPVFKTAAEGSINTATGEIVSSSAANIAARTPSIIGGEIVSNVPGGILGTATPEIGLYAAKPMPPGIGGLFQGAKDVVTSPISNIAGMETSSKFLPEFVTRQSPLTVAGAGLALKTAATPPPEPAPFVPMQPQRRTTDLSKYGYKGPLDRGEYTYADPEDIAYGRATPDSYGYLGAKEGGVIKAQGGGVMMQQGPYNPQIEAQKGTFRPTGSLVPPTAGPSISRLAQTQPMMSMSPQKIKGLAQPVAPTVPTNMPMSSPTPMMPPQGSMLPQGGGGLASQPAREPLPEIANNAQKLIDQLPQKDISVNIDSLRQFIGLAEGGEVPGMSEQAPAGATGPSSGLGVYNTSPKMSEAEFVDFVGNDMFKGNFIGRAVAELQGPELYKQLDKQGAFKMAEGGEVNSDKTLQENAFVIPADVVGHIGDGSSDAGAQRLQSYLGMNPQQYQAGGIMAGELQGPGGGMDDLIQTSIEGKRAAAVSPQEFVVPRDIVAELGQGSYDKGSNKLYALMRNVRKTKTGTTKQPAELTRGLGQLMRTAIG
jgi:hypothetical protein